MLNGLTDPVVLEGTDTTAYRDPTVVYHDDRFYLYYTYIKTEEQNRIYSYTAMSQSPDLQEWSDPKILTPKDQMLNFCAPGNVVRHEGQWWMCLQTYPRPGYQRGDDVRYGTDESRIYKMPSSDLEAWGEPELLRIKGPDVPEEEMGRIIDPYLIRDINDPGKWWCFYKQNGASLSWSRDLTNWEYAGRIDAGENVCVIPNDGDYFMLHSPSNGMGLKRSEDLEHWQDVNGRITLGQENWPWAETRITAGFALDLRDHPDIGKFLMFYHGAGPGEEETIANFDANCNIGIAWSDDLLTWDWPGSE